VTVVAVRARGVQAWGAVTRAAAARAKVARVGGARVVEGNVCGECGDDACAGGASEEHGDGVYAVGACGGGDGRER
jgi:hypothetical protein